MPRDPADGHDQGRRIGLTHKANNEPLGFPELGDPKGWTLSQKFRRSAQTWPKPHRSPIGLVARHDHKRSWSRPEETPMAKAINSYSPRASKVGPVRLQFRQTENPRGHTPCIRTLRTKHDYFPTLSGLRCWCDR